ncbi:hypothetical protein [Arcobacter sp. CECT 8983]|uniref:hypothetical protein n=1 Tax=Arcobacter sp. CECT 8983 TaxID=2044508 RepID=UPI00100B4254|nr:hypothetical protein [Arcobacter sp. CECT 8983]
MLGQCTPYGFIIKLVIIFSLAALAVTITQLFTSNSIISLIVFVVTYGGAAYFYPKAKDCQI